jgi:hypothetical protein
MSLWLFFSETAAKEAAQAKCAKLQAERSSGAKAYVTPTHANGPYTHLYMIII